MCPSKKIRHILVVSNELDETGELNQKITMNMAKQFLNSQKAFQKANGG